jgi:NAD(P)-dependent dehydrogenase (short-subunit alcohol dehydrogenase family)
MSNIEWSFAGQTVLLTGGSRGIGLAVANLFADAGAKVYALSRSTPDEALSSDVEVVACDVASQDDLSAAVRQISADGGGVDICIANAGVCMVEDFATTDPAEWSRIVDVNLLGVMRTWQAALPLMAADGRGGRLIANSSAAGVRAESPIPAYSASKAALTGLVQSLAIRYADRGITVNAVAPGEIDTDMNRGARAQMAQSVGRSSEELLHELLSEHIPAGRLGQERDIAATIAFLASEEGSYITGQTIVIDGGQLLI